MWGWAPLLYSEHLAFALTSCCPRRRQRGPSRPSPGGTPILASPSKTLCGYPEEPADNCGVRSACAPRLLLSRPRRTESPAQGGAPLGHRRSGPRLGRFDPSGGMLSRAPRHGWVQEMGGTSGTYRARPTSFGVWEAGWGTLESESQSLDKPVQSGSESLAEFPERGPSHPTSSEMGKCGPAGGVAGGWEGPPGAGSRGARGLFCRGGRERGIGPETARPRGDPGRRGGAAFWVR